MGHGVIGNTRHFDCLVSGSSPDALAKLAVVKLEIITVYEIVVPRSSRGSEAKAPLVKLEIMQVFETCR